MGIVIEEHTLTTTGLTGMAPGANPIVLGTIVAHKAGWLQGLELWGGLSGVEVASSYNFTIYTDSSRTKILVQYLAITDFTISTLIKDSSGDDINYDANGINKAYENKSGLNLLYYKFECTTAVGTITTPLLFKIVTKTAGLD